MKIKIPATFGSDLRAFNGTCTAVIEKIMLKTSTQKKTPYALFRYTINDDSGIELSEGEAPAIGETVLENFYLTENALFRLNNVWREVQGEDIPSNPDSKDGEYTAEEFTALLNEVLAGTEWNLVLEKEPQENGSERTTIVQRSLA